MALSFLDNNDREQAFAHVMSSGLSRSSEANDLTSGKSWNETCLPKTALAVSFLRKQLGSFGAACAPLSSFATAEDALCTKVGTENEEACLPTTALAAPSSRKRREGGGGEGAPLSSSATVDASLGDSEAKLTLTASRGEPNTARAKSSMSPCSGSQLLWFPLGVNRSPFRTSFHLVCPPGASPPPNLNPHHESHWSRLPVLGCVTQL